MRAVLELEFIGEDQYALERATGIDLGAKKDRPWVAQITGTDPTYGLARKFLDGQIDYNRANSTGSRGVRLYFVLKDGVYEVRERVSWKKVKRYFLLVENAQMREIERWEVARYVQAPTQ